VFLLIQSTHRMVVRYHPTLGHLYVPNLHARLPNETGGYVLATNSLGFRSDVEFEPRKGGRPRILMFGDSYTAGDNCANEDRASDQLGRLLDAEVYNFGLSGSGTDQHLLLYREFGRGIEADLAVLCVQVDSIRRIQLSHRESIDRITRERVLVPKPYFTLQEGELQLHHSPVPRERPPVGSIEPETIAATRAARDWRQRLLATWRKTTASIRVPSSLERAAARLRSGVYRLSGVQPYPDFNSRTSAGWLLMERIVRQFAAEVAPLPLLIVPIPTWEYYRHGAKPVYQEFFEGIEDRERGVHVTDVSSPLIRLPWETRQELAFRAGHFTPYGNLLLAELMAGAIRERGLLGGGAGPKQPAKPANGTRLTLSPKPAPARKRRREGPSLNILGLSCFYHNSAAALVRDGKIVAAAEEERFTRVKADRRFPHQAVNYCLEEGRIGPAELDAVVFYDNSAQTLERILHTQLAIGEEGEDTWLRALPGWIRSKVHIPQLIRKYLSYEGRVLQEVHHRSHCASAFYPSPFERAAILTIDGVGEWATASIAVGAGNDIRMIEEMRFPDSLGLLYSAFTQFTGFKVNSGEYKMMGLAPYGEPRYADRILENLVDLKEDGSLELNLEYFAFLSKPTMTSDRFAELFDGPARTPDSRITRREMDLARSVQVVTEEAMLRMARHAHEVSGGEERLCLAGGVALNCVANGRLLREGPFKDIWIQPAAGDSGCALGAALDAYHGYFGKPRRLAARPLQGGSYWGPDFSDDEIRAYLETHGFPYRELDGDERNDALAQALAEGKVVGHFSGRMEFGPRALGARSILGDPRSPEMQSDLNLKIKYRESFRPFAPSVLAERVSEYFELDRESPYMLIVAPVRREHRKEWERIDGEDLLPVVRQVRSDLPAITHVDYSARIQTVTRDDHPAYYDLIRRFEALTGCGVVVNTSFNVRGEPIICTPADAYRCFMRTEMNVLALGDFILLKREQPPWPEGRGEGLESEDAGGAEHSAQPAALLNELRHIFRSDVVPLSAELHARGVVGFSLERKPAASRWCRYEDAMPLQERMEYAPGWDCATPDPDALADALLRNWTLPVAAGSLRALLVRLLELGLRFPPTEELEEEVSESVYVMF